MSAEAVTPNRLEDVVAAASKAHDLAHPTVPENGWVCTCGVRPFTYDHIGIAVLAALRAALAADPSLVTELGGKKVWDGRQWTFVPLARDDTEEKK